MSEGRDKGQSRDPERSREAILDAAEQLFAMKGYEGTSLQEIGQHAGVSRGTPNYFFGSKEQLYGAVLDRVFEAEQVSVMQSFSNVPSEGGAAADVLSLAIGSFLDFLLARPTFPRLIEREALNDARFLKTRSSYLLVFEVGLNLVKTELAQKHIRPVDPAQLLLSIIALCWFPLVHKDTFLYPLGIQADDPAFWESRKQHIIDLVRYGVVKQ
jgi:AcrR family transcriptional regulator